MLEGCIKKHLTIIMVSLFEPLINIKAKIHFMTNKVVFKKNNSFILIFLF